MDNTEPPGQARNHDALNKIPRYVQYTSPVSLAPTVGSAAHASSLPLNLIAHIVQYLDDAADIARMTRTCRLLHYMALPQLYRKVQLHSYGEVRYVNGRPEGYGSGSPFTMALNGLVTKTHATLVEDFRLWGEWRELGVEEYARGRVPDGTVLLNTLVRAATDQMVRLRAFSWELAELKPLRTLYQGLATHDSLTHLTLRFPTSRIPRPRVLVPAMPSLRVFKATDIDPLCYPDDLSLLLFLSRQLVDVRLHFSPRMRREAEPSLNLDAFFGRCVAAGYRLRLRHFAMQNYFGPNSQGMTGFLDYETCESVTFLDVFGGTRGGSANVFVDDTWKNLPTELKTHFRVVRLNETATQHVDMLSKATPMEGMVFVNAKGARTGESPPGAMMGGGSGARSNLSPVTPMETPWEDHDTTTLGSEYLYVLTRHHGPSLRCLGLYDQWVLGEAEVKELVQHCPGLEQLGIGLGSFNESVWQGLLGSLPKLHSLRILENGALGDHVNAVGVEVLLQVLGREACVRPELKWLGVGDRVFHVGEYVTEGNWDEGGTTGFRRELVPSTWDAVEDVQIWGLDCMDISADPIISEARWKT